jgi:hypothetical protein
VIRACIHATSGDFQSVDRVLESSLSLLRANGTAVLSPSGTIDELEIIKVQTLIARGRYGDAEKLLESIPSLRLTPAGISSILQLKIISQQSSSDSEACSYLVSTAKALGKMELAVNDHNRITSLFHIAEELEKRQLYGETASVYETILACGSSLDSDSRLMATSRLIIALSHSDTDAASRYLRSFPEVISFSCIFISTL